MKNHPILSIDLIIQNAEGRILLGKLTEKWQDGEKYLWGLPGREVAFRESLRVCAERNIKEELGIELISAQAVCVNSNFGYGNHYVAVGILAIARGNPVNKKPEDWTEWKWFATYRLPSKLFPSAERTLKSFLNKSISNDFDKDG